MKSLAVLLASIWLACGFASAFGKDAVIADLTRHLVEITSGFNGTSNTIFGAINSVKPGDLVIVVRGPDEPLIVREKARIAGIWVNHDQESFTGVPSFYAVLSNRPLSDITTPQTLTERSIGIAHLRLQPSDDSGPDLAKFNQAVIDLKRGQGLFAETVGDITFQPPVHPRLFHANFNLPSTVTTGSYQATVYFFRDGKLLDAETQILIVSDAGINASIVDFAYRRPLYYGLVAVAMASLSGLIASLVFRRRA